MNGSYKAYDIAIVGAGAYGTAVLGQLSLNKKPNEQKGFRILVVERSQELGPGLPYSQQMTIPEHIVNIAGGCTQITATYIPYSERSDFLQWLRSLTPEYRASLGIEEFETPNWIYRPFPRFIVGLYLNNRFNHFVEKLREKGFTVDVHAMTSVNSVIRKNKSYPFGYELDLGKKGKVFTKTLFIATGHWVHNRFPNFQNWLPSPFPPQDLQETIKLGCSVGILGCSLSAIDTALTLSKKNGSFYSVKRNGKECLVFKPFQEAKSFKMTMYGRKAMLPQVMGVVVNKIFAYKYLLATNFIPIIEANDGFLPLDNFWYLLKKEIYDEVPHLRKHLPEDWEDISLEDAVHKMRSFLQQCDPVERLTGELEEAKESLRSGVPLLLQNVFYQSYAIFDEALNYFSAEDRIRFEDIKTELHLLIGPFPVQNAEKILALMTGGFLDIKKIGTNYTIEQASDKNLIKLTWQHETGLPLEAYHDYMVDATGQKGAFEKDFSSLTTSLRNEKLIKEIIIPFRDPEDCWKYESHPKVVKKNGSFYFRPSGALIDINNFSLVSEAPNPGVPIYYMGPFTMGQVAFPQDMSVITTAAERAVADLVKRGILAKDTSNHVEQDPSPMYGWLPNAKGDLSSQMKTMTRILTTRNEIDFEKTKD